MDRWTAVTKSGAREAASSCLLLTVTVCTSVSPEVDVGESLLSTIDRLVRLRLRPGLNVLLLCVSSGDLWRPDRVKSKCYNCERVEVLVNTLSTFSNFNCRKETFGNKEPLRAQHQHGEQPSIRRTAAPQVLCRMRGEDRRPLPALLHGALLAHSLPQVLLLPSPAGGHWHHLLQQRGHDSVSE